MTGANISKEEHTQLPEAAPYKCGMITHITKAYSRDKVCEAVGFVSFNNLPVQTSVRGQVSPKH